MPFSVTQTQFQSRKSVCHYGELHNDDCDVILSWVYDCGKKAFARKIPHNRNLDFIFISHFDSDHVNGITKLRIGNKTEIIIPYIPFPLFLITLILYSGRYSVSGRSFIYSVYTRLRPLWLEKMDSNNSVGILDEFFTYYFETPNRNEEMISVNNISIVEDESPLHILKQNIPWEFFVSSYIDKSFQNSVEQLAKDILSNGIPVRDWIKIKLGELKKKYKAIKYNISNDDINNIISMCFYAGPIEDNSVDDNLKRAGWLHTGDSCFHYQSVLKYFLKVFKKYIPHTYVLSLPHHGSNKTNTQAVLSSLFSNFSHADIVIPYSIGVRHCCHRNQNRNRIYCTEHQDVTFINGSPYAIQNSFPCPNSLCKIW